MKAIGIIIAVVIFGGVIFGLGYGIIEGWKFLNYQWSLLDQNWKPVIILISSVIIICSLLLIGFLQSSLKRNLNSSHGKTMAYNHYMNWYVDSTDAEFEQVNLNTLRGLRNEFLLWAGNHVVKQFNNLYDEFNKDNISKENVEKYARHIYIEIQRDLGRRGSMKLRQV